jgi:hypothetical protein
LFFEFGGICGLWNMVPIALNILLNASPSLKMISKRIAMAKIDRMEYIWIIFIIKD